MALVRCPKHNIPYNDANPRGCPACAREKGGEDQATLMAELARASRRIEAIPDLPPLDFEQLAAQQAEPVAEITEAPRRPLLLYSGGAITVLVAAVVALSGPKFTEQPDPPAVVGEIRPLTLVPGQSATVVFAQLGTQPPRPHPSERILQRYEYGRDLIFDAVNGLVYSMEIAVPNRVWQGLRVGLSQQEAEGAVSLLGTLKQDDTPAAPPTVRGRYLVYSSLDGRPRRVLSTEVRPPNGCYDLQVILQPHAIGVLQDDDQQYAVVGRGGDALVWTVTRIHALSRALPGPLAGPPIC